MVENGGRMSPAMKQAGYSEAYAKHPEKLRRTKTWEQLLDEYLPDDKLIRIVNEGLSATIVKTSLTEPNRTVPDFAVRHRYLETSLKMRGKLIERTDIKSDEQQIGGFVIVKTEPLHPPS